MRFFLNCKGLPMTTPGKLQHLRRLADANGVFKMVAVDQRPPIAQIIAKGRGIAPADAACADICALKRLLAQELAPHCTAILVDPNFAYPAAIDVIPARAGLILTLEEHRFAETAGGRRSDSIPHWGVEKIKKIGGDGVKVLAWYRPDAAAEINAHQRAYVASVGKACADFDIPFIFELLVYPFPGTTEHTAAYVEDRAKQPQMVIDSVREFADPKYGVDLFKLESPVPAAGLPKAGDAESAARVQALFDDMGRAAGRPWVMLSAGAGMADFAAVLEHAFKAGASGFLAGRAIWWQALQAFPDIEACRAALRAEGVPYFARLAAMAEALAVPWQPDFSGLARFKAEGEFAQAITGFGSGA